MLATSAIAHRHTAEVEMLQRALAGQTTAIDSVLSQLSSANQWLQLILVEAIQDCVEPMLWQRLLEYLALHRWADYAECGRWADPESARRLEASLTQLFVTDDLGSASTPVKLQVLNATLKDPECRLRSAAAALLGLRGEAQGMDILVETVRHGEPDCQMRAVAALGKLKDERGGWALVEALACDDERLHWEASRALSALGDKALPALLEAMKSPKPHVRWHSVRALGGIGDPQAMAVVAEALGDMDYSVRWAASDALAGFGLPAVAYILERLARYAPMDDLYQAAYHALHRIGAAETQARLRPLLKALHGPAAPAEAPMAAYRLLQEWGKG